MFIVIENDTEMSETDPFYSEESEGMSKRTQLEEYFSQSLEVELLLRLCPDDEDTIYQIVDLLVDTCATNRKLLHICLLYTSHLLPSLKFQRIAVGDLVDTGGQGKREQEDYHADGHAVTVKTGVLLAVHIA